MSWQSCELGLGSVDFFAMQGGEGRHTGSMTTDDKENTVYTERSEGKNRCRYGQRSSAKKDTLAKLRFNLAEILVESTAHAPLKTCLADKQVFCYSILPVYCIIGMNIFLVVRQVYSDRMHCAGFFARQGEGAAHY
ncbi:hypothetical protein SAMN04488502_101278 [Dendrosporobacter quercicolus]|uniref:Uncharacterized protein n=1 Tax=Dendrosporobacter quercicolus TaxID=146817 RepID=A0A1G9L9A9_9FIRM|nr:hypothetical protein SAMN04488502_101278 [Dendrosporobacter quercicolus]